MKNKALIVVLLVVVVLVVVYLLLSQRGYVPAVPEVGAPAADDTTAVINQGLEGVDLGDLDAEFQAIDQELNNL